MAGSDASDADYGTPYYLAGYDDQNGGLTPRSEWLQLQQDPNNHDLYSATWAPPASPSDFYVDVVVNDDQGRSRIYDNTWGFSTLPFNPSPTTANDILVCQRQRAGPEVRRHRPQRRPGQPAPDLLRRGAYFTDIDTSLLPNSVQFWTQPNGQNPTVGPIPPATMAMPNPTGQVVAGGDQRPQQLVQDLNNVS